jgi:Rod binding domain-containing protein
MDLPGIQKTAGLMLETAEQSAGSTRLRQLAEGTGGKETRAELLAAARQFEGVFLNTLMKAMRQTVPENKLFNSNGPTKFYQQMYDTEIAKALATGNSGMGVADLIVRQFEATVGQGDSQTGEGQGTKTPEVQTPAVQTPAVQPDHPLIGPPAPQALQRYESMSSVGEVMAQRQKLRFFASRQGTAVADTLQKFEDGIGRAALKTGLEPALILAVVMEESGGNPQARSDKGAQGLMQLMPGTALEMGVNQPDSPRENLLGGSAYLAKMLDRYDGDLDLALAAYNAGPGNVDKAGKVVPDFPETRRYVQRVKSRYQALSGGTEMANENQ